MKMLTTIPVLPVENIDDAVAFYEGNLGFVSRPAPEPKKPAKLPFFYSPS